MTLLKHYKSLSTQAEDLNDYEGYKELIQKIRQSSYEELFNMMADTEQILTVLIREDIEGDSVGLLVTVDMIMALGEKYLEKHDWRRDQTPKLRYTYEFIEEQRKNNT